MAKSMRSRPYQRHRKEIEQSKSISLLPQAASKKHQKQLHQKGFILRKKLHLRVDRYIKVFNHTLHNFRHKHSGNALI